MNKVHSLLISLIENFSSAASFAQVQPTAVVSSRLVMAVKREVIFVGEDSDDPGVANVGTTLSDPYAEYEAEAYDDKPQRDAARRWDMSIGVEDVHGPNVVAPTFKDAYSVNDIQSEYAEEEGRRPWRKRCATVPAEPFHEELPSKMSKKIFGSEHPAAEHLSEWQFWIKHELANASDETGEEQGWYSQSRQQINCDTADTTRASGEKQSWQRRQSGERDYTDTAKSSDDELPSKWVSPMSTTKPAPSTQPWEHQTWRKHVPDDAPNHSWYYEPWIKTKSDTADATHLSAKEQPWLDGACRKRCAVQSSELPKKKVSLSPRGLSPLGPPATVGAGIMCTRRRASGLTPGVVEVLAIRKWHRWIWEFPKGRRAGTWESNIDTAYREFQKETGICLTALENQRSKAIYFATQTYPTSFEPQKEVHWFWLHLDNDQDMDKMFRQREYAKRELRWFTCSQMWNNKFMGDYAMKELAAQALEFTLEMPMSSSS